MTYILDTDTCIDVLRRRPAVLGRFIQTRFGDCAVSTVTTFELFSGLAKARDPLGERRNISAFLQGVIQLPFEGGDAEMAANIGLNLLSAGTPIGAYDVLIAAHAMHHGLTLVTNNAREFNRVAGLRLESWR